jgi:heat shock protein HslJ
MEGTVWRLTELHGKVMIEEANSPTFHLEATGKKVNGFGGCNRFTATYQLNGKTVSCRDAIATKMVCETGMDIENEFFSLLLQMNTFKIRGRELIFLQRGKRVAIFVVQPDRKY